MKNIIFVKTLLTNKLATVSALLGAEYISIIYLSSYEAILFAVHVLFFLVLLQLVIFAANDYHLEEKILPIFRRITSSAPGFLLLFLVFIAYTMAGLILLIVPGIMIFISSIFVFQIYLVDNKAKKIKQIFTKSKNIALNAWTNIVIALILYFVVSTLVLLINNMLLVFLLSKISAILLISYLNFLYFDFIKSS